MSRAKPLIGKEGVVGIIKWFRHRKDLLKPVQRPFFINPVSGLMTIASATKVFQAIDIAFKGCDVIGSKMPMTSLEVYELRRDATLREMFEWLKNQDAKRNLSLFVLTQHQICEIVEKYRDSLFKEPGQEAYMLFNSQGQNCVAVVSARNDKTLAVNFFLLDYPNEWLAELKPRIIIPTIA